MNKTLHKKLTENHLYKHTPALAYFNGDDMQPDQDHELNLLRTDAKNLMQPRQQAISNILKLARSL